MKKHEAELQRIFSRWLAHSKKRGVYELKRTTGLSIPYSDVKEHQREALIKSESKDRACIYKIPDDSFGQKPFDAFCLSDTPAYIIVSFGETIRSFYIIPIHTWLKLEKDMERKSITEDLALAYGTEISVRK